MVIINESKSIHKDNLEKSTYHHMDPFPLFLFLTGASPPRFAAFAEFTIKTLININTNNTDNVHVDNNVVGDIIDTFFFIFDCQSINQ